MPKDKKNSVPEIVIARLAIYLRELEQMGEEHADVISSQNLAKRLALSAVQIRKDLSYFGDFGKQGQGYSISSLTLTLRQILNAHKAWPVILVGVGQLGKALILSKRLEQQGFQIEAIFDNDHRKIGQRVNGHHILHIDNLPLSVKRLGCQIGIICTPGSMAQHVAELMIDAGINSILNYAPATLIVPDTIHIQHVDPVVCLRQMTYHLKAKPKKSSTRHRLDTTVRTHKAEASALPSPLPS